MIKVLGYFVLILFTVIYLVSSSSALTHELVAKKIASTSIFRSDKYKYGDLYGMSYLPEYRIIPVSKLEIPIYKCDTKPAINLYAICDSYLWSFLDKPSFYCGVDSLFYAKTNSLEQLEIPLNPNKKNILLLEFSERNFRLILNIDSYVNNLFKTKDSLQDGSIGKEKSPSFIVETSRFLFNKNINTNLELNIWDFPLCTIIKEFKADVNRRLFNVIDHNVVISPDKKYLFYNPTVDTSVVTSSFQNIPDAEIKTLVAKLNRIYDTSKSLGFNEVYLTIIPNPVSILAPSYNGLHYNKLISRIQNSTDLKMPVIDIYSTFQQATLPVYIRTDTHWSIQGAYLWLNKFNRLLKNQTSDKL